MLRYRDLVTITASAALAMAVIAPIPAQAQNKNVIIALTDEPTDLDACNATQSTVGRVAMQNFYETLTIMDPDTGELKPLLATSWEQISPNAWRFNLRKDVKFHDGQSMTAAGIASAIQRTLSPDLQPTCSARGKFFGTDKFTFKTPDDHTLEIHAEKPEPILPTRMSQLAIPAPGANKTSLTREPVGSGPYKLVHWKTGEEIVVTRNEDYWGEKSVVDGARFIWRQESAVRASMVKIGEADLTDNIAVQDANDPKTDYSFPNTETSYLRIDLTRAPFTDKRVRRAVGHAIDREALKGIISKDAIIATQLIMPSIPGHNHELDKNAVKYDLALAKKLLAEAKADGVDVGKEIEIQGRVNVWQNATESMEAVMAMLQEAGFNIKLKMYDRVTWLALLNKPHDENRGPSLIQVQHDNNFGDAIFSVPSRYRCAGNQGFLCDESMEKLLDEAAATPAPKRYELYKEVFRRAHDEFVTEAWLYHMVGYTRVNPRINFKPNASLNSMIPLSRITFN